MLVNMNNKCSSGGRLIASITFVLIYLFIGATCDDGIPTNPCAAVLCITNTTCIAVPDPSNCQPRPYMNPPGCPLRAMCVPNGVQLHYGETPGIYCGINGDKCSPGYKCDFVYPFCPIDVNPCLPMLACVPLSGQPIPI